MKHIHRTLVAQAPLDTCYRVWTDFERYPRFMKNITCVYQNRDGTWHWEAKAPMGQTIQWDAHVEKIVKDKLVSWYSEPGSELETEGRVEFEAISTDKTLLTADFCYAHPAGPLGEFIADVFKHSERMVDEDLSQFKLLVEHMALREKDVQNQLSRQGQSV